MAIEIFAEAKRTRPRGFVRSWRPISRNKVVLEQVRSILVTCQEYGAMTVRQIFYRLVATCEFPKTEQAYGRVAELLANARRAREIPMAAVRDDGADIDEPWGYTGVRDLSRSVGRIIDAAPLRPNVGQPVSLILACEAAGMAPMLRTVAELYGAPVIPGGGFDSLTAKFAIAEWLVEKARPGVILHVGDHDPSGVHVFQSFAADIGAFAAALGGTVSTERIAVRPEHIAPFGLPTAPPKKTDGRAFTGTETVQAEALAQDDLLQIARASFERHFDRGIYEAAAAGFDANRAALRARWAEIEEAS